MHDLTKLELDDVVNLLEQTGYRADDITEVQFASCGSGRVKYKIKFENLDGEIEDGNVFISISDSGKLIASF